MKLVLNQEFTCLFEVSHKVYEGFISVFNDRNPLHTDVEFALRHGYKEKVMHGNILNGFISFFIGELLPTDEVMILAQNINYKNPVYLNNVLRFEAKVVEQSEAVQVDVISFKFRNEENNLVASGKIQIKEL